ncbi:MAG: class I SAM-dependent methyltransferase [Elusimicrobiota bacterium]
MFLADVNLERSRYKGAVVLEAGIGEGKYLPYVLDREPAWLFGVDSSDAVFPVYAKLAGRSGRTKLCLCKADIQKLPLKESRFDIVYSTRVLHQLPDMARGFRGLHSLLKKKGVFVAVIYAETENGIRMIRFVERIKRMINAGIGLKPLYALSIFPAALIYLILQGVYRPLGHFAWARRALPLYRALGEYWARYDFLFLWQCTVFDVLMTPEAKYTSEPELKALLSSLPLARCDYELQHEAMWTIRMVR